ncbi:MAG: hypothetical protein JXB50_05690 [Spirochaetes bacterium]|nr:hypothetical protein [Spirochaetota bacterium]
MKTIRLNFILIILFITCNLFSQDDLILFKIYDLDSNEYLKPENKNKLQFIFYVLLNTGEHYSHNLGGLTTNKVYVHKDGHGEAVYDKDGKLVTDSRNQGSYNFYPAQTAPLEHFSADTLLWIVWGNAKEDPSTKKERIEAYAKDFLDGCFIVISNWGKMEELPENIVKNEMQKNTLNFFLKILNGPEFKEYKFDGMDPWIKNQDDLNKFEDKIKKKLVEYLNK